MIFPVSFVVLCLALAAAFLAAVRRVAPERLAGSALGVALWLAVPAALASLDLLSFETRPPTMLVLLLVLVAGTVLVARGELGGRLAHGVPLSVLVGYQAFRILVEAWLHHGHVRGVFPEQMTWSGLNFDVLTGLSAVLVAALVHLGRAGRRAVLAWNVLGLGLLLAIVTIAILSAPLPFRVFHEGPPNVYPTSFPGIWLPAVAVQAALLGHLLVFRRLLGDGSPDRTS